MTGIRAYAVAMCRIGDHCTLQSHSFVKSLIIVQPHRKAGGIHDILLGSHVRHMLCQMLLVLPTGTTIGYHQVHRTHTIEF
jgi:hypothetical protein